MIAEITTTKSIARPAVKSSTCQSFQVVDSGPVRCDHAVTSSGTVQNLIAGNGLPKFETCGEFPGEIERINKPTVTTCATILNLPILDTQITTPSVAAIDRKPVTANSRPTMITTAQAGARSFLTSEINAAEIKSLSAIGSSNLPSVETCFQLRANFPSK